MKNLRVDILSRPVFIFGLGLLLLNDFYLKYQYSNMLTGKISDFAGLFIFPYFLSSLRTSYAKGIYLTTLCAFVFWKSAFSQGLIEFWQSMGIGVNRIVDPTDLIALSILPISYIYFKKQLNNECQIRKVLTIGLYTITIFAIWATTLPRERVAINIASNQEYILELSKSDFLSLISPSETDSLLKTNSYDSLFYLYFHLSNYNARLKVLATIKDLDSDKTVVRLDSILNGQFTGRLFSGVGKDKVNNFKSNTAEDFERYFEGYFIAPVRRKKAKHLHYDPKKTKNHSDYIKTDERSISYQKDLLDDQFENWIMLELTDTIVADLNGDSIPDKAIYIRNDESSGIIIIHGGTNEEVKIGFGYKFAHLTNFDWVDFWGIVNDSMSYEILIEHDLIVGDRDVRLPNPAIFLRKDEDGGGLITYKEGNYLWIHQAH